MPYKFRIRFEDYSALSNSKFLITGQELVTDRQGIINLSLPALATYVNIGSSDLKSYVVRYPLEGRAILPKDPATFIDIYISKPNPDKMELVSAKLTAQSTAIAKLEKKTTTGYNEILRLLKENQRKGLSAAAQMKGRTEFLPLITESMNTYLRTAKDLSASLTMLSSAMQTVKNYQRVGNQTVAQVSEKIVDYNEAFSFTDKYKDTYKQAIAVYWNSQELATKYSNLIDVLIYDFHKPYILGLNNFIIRLYSINQLDAGKQKGELKNLSNDLKTHADAMSTKLNDLSERITTFNAIIGTAGTN
ncbi:hypothetical protein GS399_01525 [Pedobacter sp. HMF7647]|uniref:Uncharacterized protein n=1 Tax=Hufsiella arboris TaxID=2695275 RepID=A0A7K1Y4Y0_9SPHI|nr:hypothetical protein [Hufsiella arboris]MXV49636.1 hypothetical protein [Hufsiella arboris]